MTGVSWCAAGCTIVETVAKCSLFMDGIAIYGSLFLKLWHPLKRADPANTADPEAAQWPRRSILTPDLESVTSITLGSYAFLACISFPEMIETNTRDNADKNAKHPLLHVEDR